MRYHRRMGKMSLRAAGSALLFLMALGAPVWGQGRAAATAPAQAPATPAQTPAAAQGGRGGRGGVAGPPPAIGGDVDETPVVTRHSINVSGKELHYTATVAQMP